MPAGISDRLNGLVHGSVARSYLWGDDGYWADLVLDRFAFLEERGGRLTALAFHQAGDYITYEGPWGSVTLTFFPDNFGFGPWIEASANLRTQRSAFHDGLDRLVRKRRPGTTLTSLATKDRATIRASVDLWADVLREATDLF